MSKINKLITNKPVTLTEEEVTNLSKTLSAVQTAGGGGGGGGRVYYGDNSTISVNQIDGIISLTTEATEKLNTPVPTKVSDLTDYKDYQTVDKMSAYLTTAQYNSDSAKFATKTELETTAATFEGLIQSYVQGLASETWVTAQGYLTKPSGDLYYTPLPAGLSDDQYYAMTKSGWKVIQGGGGQGGISTVAHDSSLSGNGNSENLGIKTDAALNLINISAKSAVYANIAKGDHTDYNLGSTLDTMSNITALIDATLKSISSYNGIERQIDETTYYTTAFGLTNSAYAAVQYVTANSGKFVTSGDEIIGDYQYALTTTGWAKVQAGSTFTGVTTTGSVSGGGVNNDTIGLLTSAENALATIGNKVDVPDTTQESLNNKYLVYSTLSGTGTVTGWTDFNANVYSKTESDGRYVATADVGSGLYYSGSSPKLGVKLGTDLAFNTTTSAIQINTDGTTYGAHAFVEGTNTTASGAGAHAEGVDAGAIGQGAHAGGYGTHTTGVGNFIHGTFLNFASPDGTTNSNTPVFVGGTLNATTAQDYNDHGGYLQIMGNGAYTGGGQGNNSDAYILYRDGTVKAKTFIAGGDTLSANYPVPKSVPNTGDNTMVVQKMFVCTSDADIVAHAALANGEGCVFFRVG